MASLKHATKRHAIDDSGLNSEADNPSCVLIHHQVPKARLISSAIRGSPRSDFAASSRQRRECSPEDLAHSAFAEQASNLVGAESCADCESHLARFTSDLLPRFPFET